MQTVLRTLPADTPLAVEYQRGGETHSALVSPPPDWNPSPDWTKAFAVILRRDPKVLAYQWAAVRQVAESGKPDDALAQLQAWPAGWRTSSVGQLLLGEILLDQGDAKGSLGAYNRAAKADATISAAQFGRGLAFARLGRSQDAADAFGAAAALDTLDPVALSFRSYALTQADQAADALVAANRAISLDRTWYDGHIARALALYALGRTRDGVVALRRGLLLLPDQDRAKELITKNLEPTDP
jgi:tetratricopeptide (TPR) repeat protein